MDEIEKLLNSLHDASAPTSMQAQMPAVGIILLASCVVFAVIFTCYKMYKWYFSPKRLALKNINKILKNYGKYNNSHFAIIELSIVLRRLALACYSREEVASLTGIEWLEFLNKTGNTEKFTIEGKVLITAPYEKTSDVDVDNLVYLSKMWVKNVC